jgi:hypothetical protein
VGNLALQVLSIQRGRVFAFNNDIPALLQKCFSDIAPYYEISFVYARLQITVENRNPLLRFLWCEAVGGGACGSQGCGVPTRTRSKQLRTASCP